MAASAAPTRVLAVVVSFNSASTLERCIGSLLEQEPAAAVVVLDNASSDDSTDRVAAAFGADGRVRLIRGADNPGFAAAVNRAVSRSDGPLTDYLLVINPDCELKADALAALVSALDGEPRAALAAPLVLSADGSPQRANLRRFPDPWRSLMTFSGLWRLGGRWKSLRGVEDAGELPQTTTLAEAVSGACMLVRRDAYLGVGGMDTGYRLHCEDLDLMYRLRAVGGQALFVPGARAVHLQGVSSASRPLWAHWHKHLGMQRFFRKFQAADRSWPVRILVVTGIWLRWLVTLPVAWLRR